jgi:outer membrane biosynthesis protein TonB
MTRRPGARPVLVSVAIHLALVVPVVVFTRAPEPTQFETIRITLVSEPAPVEATRPPETAPEPEPEPEPAPPEPEPAPPEPEPTPATPTPTPPAPTPPRPTPPAPTPPAPTPPTPAQPTPDADVNILTEGVEFPFPDYINNVVLQVHRYFRWRDASNPRGTIYFEILPDGSVRNIRMVRPSGNLRFDFEVQGAVETAGNRGAFGPLPEDFAGASLPVLLVVEPPR